MHEQRAKLLIVVLSLYGLGLLIEDAAAQVDAAPNRARVQLGRAVDRLNAAIADLRTYVLVSVEPEAEAILDRSTREAVFDVAADALGNVARHARARRVQLRLARESDGVLLEVSDDGVGFDPDDKVGSLGLRNMRQRAFDVGARLDISSKPGSGTRLQMRVQRHAEVTA